MLEARHQPSRFSTQFDGAQLPFSEYLSRTRDMLAKAHANKSKTEQIKRIDGNAPFQLWPSGSYSQGLKKPFRRGVLLTHGLTDSPYFMRYLATFFQENGFRVMAILLPGHGTQPGDLLEVNWQEWAKAVAYGTDQLAAEVDEVYLAGYSAGSALSINQSLHDLRVRGLFLFSPALKISPRAAQAHWHKFYSWLYPAAKWVNLKPDKDIYKYESFPKNAAAQMHKLTQVVNAQLQTHPLDIPVFAAASQDDSTALCAATIAFMAQTRHPASKLVLYTTNTETVPPDLPVNTANKLERVNSVFPAQKILSSAHTAVVLPAEDPHYGMGGTAGTTGYSNCVHYYPAEMEKYKLCNERPTEVMQGEITAENLNMGTLRRLMYNPNFAALKASLKQFIDGLPR